MKPPTASGLALARYYRARAEHMRERILDAMTAGWDRNPVHASGRVPRADASSYVTRAIRAIVRVQEAAPPDPRAIDKIGERVDRKNAAGQRVLGVPNTQIASTAQINVFRERNLALIRKLDADQVDRLRDILETAEREAWRVEQVRAAAIEELEITKRHADLIARDQVLKLNGQLTEQRQVRAGVTSYEWSTSGDERVRPDHLALDGTVQLWSSPPVTDEKTGERNHPGRDFQCRCVAIPILD